MSLVIASVQGEVPHAVEGADLIELRIDSMPVDDACAHVPDMLARSPLPIVLTCRSASEGGSFCGDEEDRIAIYTAALESSNPPRYIDIEHEVLLQHPLLLDSLPLGETGVILSWHDPTGRPQDLLQRATAIQDVAGIDVVKMVWRARSLRDNLEAFDLLRTRQQPMIAMCLGEYGLMSRVLAPKFGGFATYASVDGYSQTAAGQPTVAELHGMFRFRSINADTSVYGVIGNNVAHSRGPAFHNAAFDVAGTNAVYLPLPIPSGWEHLKATILSLKEHDSFDLKGASVTIPHKEHMLKLVDEADEACATVGATNTVAMTEKGIVATNTDIGALETLVPHANRVLILGGGGVARAAIAAMKRIGASVFVTTRKKEQAATLADEFSCEVAPEELSGFDTLINCTPVGMRDSEDPDGDPATILAPTIELTPPLRVVDLVYDPVETPLLRRARSAGCDTISGDTLFQLQAEEQQRFWSCF